MSRRVNMTEGMLDVIVAATSSVEAAGDEHEAVPTDPAEAEKFWRDMDRLNRWLRQQYATRSARAEEGSRG